MKKITANKKIILFIVALVTALCVIISAVFGFGAGSVGSGGTLVAGAINASANGEGSRVTMLDLMGRYPIDYVLGPLATKATDGENEGKYIDENGNVLLDKNGEETNNTYGIPRKQYFDVESYIYTTGEKDSEEGRTLYGWKPNICGIDPISYPNSISENGTIVYGLADAIGKTGIYVSFNGSNRFGTTSRYAMIVPKDITAIGQGSAAFVGTDENGIQTTYYNGTPTEGNNTLKTDTENGKATAQFTDFACFIMAAPQSFATGSAPYFWQPRERLLGVYFPEDSRLQTVEGSADSYSTDAEAESNRTSSNDIGKTAFLGCDNLRFLILPSANAASNTTGLQTIGKNAFFGCKKLVDINIPSSVTNIGSKACGNLTEILHITIPQIETVSTDAFEGCTKLKSIIDIGGKFNGQFNGYGYEEYVTSKDDYNNNIVYIFAGAPTKNSEGQLVNDTGLYGFELIRRSTGWSAVGLAGATGEDETKVFVLPDGTEFNENSVRRTDVKYDYIDCDGEKRFSSFNNENVTNYEIADNFAYDTWCQNVIMPKEITKIGANAFNNSNLRYIETYATEIGAKAFAGTNNKAGEQWYYFHSTTGNPQYTIASDAFVDPTSFRHVVFETQEMWNNITLAYFRDNMHVPLSNTTRHFLIPLVVNIDNADELGVTVDTSDMDNYFFYDSDYVKNPVVEKGKGSIVYSKRLTQGNSGTAYDYTYVKQYNGRWIKDETLSNASNIPTLSNMTETMWYKSDYSTVTDAKKEFGEKPILTNGTVISQVNIYTKNIARPANIASGDYDGVYKGDYTFGQTYTFGTAEKTLGDADDQSIDFSTVLGLSSDYSITLTKFTYAGGNADGTSKTVNLHNAGSYSFNIGLNPKWGVWSQKYIQDNAEYFTASATVERKTIDYSSINKVPKFMDVSNATAYVLNGDRTPLYKYNDGWYIAQKEGETPNDTKTITNSYCYYTGDDITIEMLGENVSADGSSSTLGDVEIISRNGLTFAGSSEYTASFVFQVKYIPGTNNQYSNYVFYYGDGDDTKYNNVTDDEKGISVTGKQDNYFRLTKKWYIVVQTNMFVNGEGSNAPYLPLEGNVHYADNISVQVPALLYGNAAGKIEFAIDYVPVSGGKAVEIKERAAMGADAENTIAYYINSSMPAGTYTLKLFGAKVTVTADGGSKSYSAISGEYVINILPKVFDETTIDEIHNTLRGEQVADPSAAETELEKYINAYPLTEVKEDKKLHKSIDSLLDSLNETLENDRGNGTNYWSDKDEYFDAVVTVGYNREGSGNTVYMSKSAMLDSLATANTYTIYYSISAKNYETVGGADAQDRQQRGFRTTLYTAMALSEIYDMITAVDGLFFKDATYTGDVVRTSVPYSKYYSYSFDDEDYVNVGTRTVTLTLNDPDLARWEPDGNDYSEYFVISDNGKSLYVYFDIVAADNDWNVMPQMPSWTFNGFDKNVNSVTSGLKFNSTVKYALIPGTVTSPLAVEWGIASGEQKVSGVDSNGVAFFTVNDSGIVDGATAVMLNALKPANYYLKFFVSEIYAQGSETVNVNAYSDIARNSSGDLMTTVTIGKAVNRWSSTPNVVRWSFGGYDPETNLITAVALYPALLPKDENGDDITGFVYTKDGVALTAAQSKFKFTVYNGLGVDVTSSLASLDAGTYFLATSMDESDYYTEIAETRMSFIVGQAVNSWDTQPVITGFVYKQFDADNDFIAGVPHFPIENKTVYYVIGNRAFTEVKTLADFQKDGYAPTGSKYFTLTDTDAIDKTVADYFNGLGNDTYYFAVFVPAADNYSYLFYAGSFNVSQTNNYWQNATPPDIRGWTYGAFEDSLFTYGTPIHGTATYTVRKVVDGEVDKTENGIAKIGNTALKDMSYAVLKGVIKDLGAGTYSLEATSGSTADYAEAKASKQFTVAKADNEWGTNPSINGWTFDNETVAAGNKGAAKYENAEITEKYYYTTTDSNGNLIADTLKNVLTEVKDAGSYAYVLIVSDTANYNGFTTTLFFTVAQDDNGWETSPAGSYNWTWGSSNISTITNNIINAAAHNGVVSFSIVRTDGNYTAPTGKSISELLEILPVGKYTITASVAPDANHMALIPVEAYVEVLAAQLTVTTEPACVGWTWGVADENKVFTNIVVTPAKESDSVSIVYSVSADGGNNWMSNAAADYDYLLDYLRSSERKVGEYKVRITANCINHESVTRTVDVTIGAASFVWSGTQKDVAWDWNGDWKESDGGRDIPNWTATDCHGNAVTLSYTVTVNNQSYDGKNYNYLKSYLQSATLNAGVYTVNVKAKLDNHADAEKSFTVTVNVADNTWTTEPNASYSFEYLSWDEEGWTGIDTPAAKFGTVSCVYHSTNGDVPIANINDWIKDLSASSTPYMLTVTVPAKEGQYKVLTKDIKISIAGIGSTWSNVNDLLAVDGASDTASVYNFTYSATVFDLKKDSEMTTVVFPKGGAGGITTYSVSFNGSAVTGSPYYVLSDLLAYFASNDRTAGTYIIQADYAPTNASYAPLSYTVTIVVAKAEVEWNEKLESSYSQTYNSVNVPNPKANKDFAAVAVTVKKSGNVAALDMKGMTLADFVKTLDVGTYTITATIADSANYYVNGDRETTSILYIGAIQNAWKDVTVGDKTITAAEWTDGYTWKFTRGETISLMLPESVIGELEIIFNGTPTSIKTLAALNDLLNDNGKTRAAGTYKLRFTVAATDNYNGLVSNCEVVIDLKDNDWTQPLETITASGSVDTDTFKMPIADVYEITVGENETDLRLFNIVKAGSAANSNWYTTENFLTALAELANGTYTVTVRIGGNAPTTALDSFKKALELYNADYEEISCSCFITVTPAENTWLKKLSDMSWTWGDTVSAALAEAKYGNNKIIYTINGNNSEWIVRTSTYNEDIQTNTLNKLNETLKILYPGTYTITASIDGTELYAAPTEVNFALFTVSKYAANWKDYTDEDLKEYSLLNMTWKQAASDFLPDLTVKYLGPNGNVLSDSASVVWRIGNERLTESVIAALKKRDVGTCVVTATYAGDFLNESLTFTATVVIEPLQVSWSGATETAVKQHSWVLNSETNSALTQPALNNADGCTVTYTLVKVGSAGTLYSGTAWNNGANSLMGVLSAQKAGTYEITATASGNDNYALPTDVVYTLTISAQPNEWLKKPQKTEITWVYKSTDNERIEFKAKYNDELLVITVGTRTIKEGNLMTLLESYGVGTYTFMAHVPATDQYAAPDPVTITLEITQASDSFGECEVPASWDWDDVGQKTGTWQTAWNTEFKVPVPTVSETSTAIVSIGTTEQFVSTLHYYKDEADGVKKVLETDLNALKSKLLGLHVGTYTIEFVVADSANYEGCKVVKTFEVLKVDNSWDGSNGVPKIAGWEYNSSVANPTATPVFGKGTVKFSYAKAGTETESDLKKDDTVVEWHETTETAGGTYWLRAFVPGTSDYNSLVGYCKFSINAGQNGWVNNPGVIAWDWNGYNKTVNLFSGSAKNNGTATFKIYVGTSDANNRNLNANDFAANGVTFDKTVAINQFCSTGFTLVKENNVMVVSNDVAKYLKALKPNTYLLSVSIAEDNNYASLNGYATFEIRKAANSWASGKAPAVSSYTYGNYNETSTFTSGETVYGAKAAVIYKLEGTTYDGDKVTKGGDSNSGYVAVQGWLSSLPAGNYTLFAWVAGSSDGTYSALYNSDNPYPTRAFTVARATNSWTNTELVTQINKAYSEIRADGFDATAFEALYAKLLHRNPDATVNYALLNSDYSPRNNADALTYATLFDKIKGLPAGEYFIRATVAQTNNYLAIAATDTRLTISTYNNAFTSIPAALSAQWARDDDKKNATVLEDFEVKASYGQSTVTYTLGTSTYASYELFKAAVKTLDAGPYNVTITIAGTDEYAGLSQVCMLTVDPADNSWQSGWSVDGSLSAVDATARAASNSWAWKSTVSWTRAVPKYGTTVYVEIRKVGASSALQYITVDYSVGGGNSAVNSIGEALSRLDVGNYEIIVSAPASGNWKALSNKTEFEVTKVANGWKTAPHITGATDDNKWVYGATAIPGAEPEYGVARYEYATKSGSKLTAMPTEAGEYVIKFIVDNSTNYDGISGSLNVTIEKDTNRNFSVALGAIGWSWGSYDRATNVFTGRPEITDLENAPVTFSVGTGTGADFAALPNLSKFTLTANGLVEKDSKVEAALSALTGGTSKENNTTQYTLRIHVGETDNYNGFIFDSTFAVSGATNTWTKTPSIVTWAVNHWTSESLPSAAALYGAPTITITGETDGVVYFEGTYKKVEGSDELELVVEVNDLNLAPAGYYEMLTSVGTVKGQYNIPLTASSRFKIDVKGAGEANYWEELPNIKGWEANIEGLFNSPTGKPIRGLPNFVFYVRNEDGTRGKKVDSSLTDVVLKKGNKYEADIYIPVEYGDYILVASTNGNPTETGKSDSLPEYEIHVIIDPRPLSFEEEPRISTLLYLGDRNNWASPTTKPSLDDAEIAYVYTNKETGVSSTEMPTEEGVYTVTATISALYCESVSKSVEFTVKLSPNGWVSAPNIKDWSAETNGNTPVGSASVGSDQIVYTYASVNNPHKTTTVKPTAEGSYIMYADLIVDGYEPLHAEYRFTIAPAFDTQLVIAAIALGVIACALAGVVIYFAIRRFKEN